MLMTIGIRIPREAEENNDYIIKTDDHLFYPNPVEGDLTAHFNNSYIKLSFFS